MSEYEAGETFSDPERLAVINRRYVGNRLSNDNQSRKYIPPSSFYRNDRSARANELAVITSFPIDKLIVTIASAGGFGIGIAICLIRVIGLG